MGMRHPHDVLQMVEMLQGKFDQMHEMFLGIPLAADEGQVTSLTIHTDGSASVPSFCRESQEMYKVSLVSLVVR